MRFLARNAIFFLFPVVIVAIVILARMSLGTAALFGEWGERSIAESTLLVAKEKVERVEQTIGTTDDSFFHTVDPASLDLACERWQRHTRVSRFVEAAAIVDENDDIAAFFHREEAPGRSASLHRLLVEEVVPLIDRFESLDRYKHLHRRMSDGFRLVTYLTTSFEGQDYTTCLLYDTTALVEDMLKDLLGNVGADLKANVVDDQNRIIYGQRLDEAGEFIVVRRFPSTLYKWRLQLAPESAPIYTSSAEARRLSEVMMIPSALAVIVLGLAALYLAVVRERRLNRLQSEFIANVSHELKTPLSLIRMFGELLAMRQVDDEQRAHRYHEIILRETERLTSLIDNVLDFANIERGKSAYDLKVMNVAEVVERGVDVYRFRLEKMGLALELNVEDDLPQARIDDHAITLAVVNLIDNAAKYARGADRVVVGLSHRDGQVLLEVADNGEGIPEGHLKRIFERFYRVPGTEARKQRGSGIGLSLVHNIAVSHGGKVEVTSVPGKETRFTIRIPAIERPS